MRLLEAEGAHSHKEMDQLALLKDEIQKAWEEKEIQVTMSEA